jgi:hypothetical protein
MTFRYLGLVVFLRLLTATDTEAVDEGNESEQDRERSLSQLCLFRKYLTRWRTCRAVELVHLASTVTGACCDLPNAEPHVKSRIRRARVGDAQYQERRLWQVDEGKDQRQMSTQPHR